MQNLHFYWKNVYNITQIKSVKIFSGVYIMKRRDFFEAGLLAIVSSALAHPLGKVFYRSAYIEGSEIEKSTREQDKIAATKLMEKYEIPTLETASELYQRALSERAKYYAGGAFAGSVIRSTNNELNPSTRRAFLHRAVNVFASGGASLIGAYPAKSIAGSLQESPLTKPETLINEYSLSPRNAAAFCDEYNEMLTDGAQSGAMTATFLQELLLPAPEEETVDASEHNDSVS